jgi:hypothetical protein
VEDHSLLPSPLRTHLATFNILRLAQARDSTRVFPLSNLWIKNGKLNLNSDATYEWDTYTYALRSKGISLTSDSNTIIWAGGDALRVISVKNIYTALLQQLNCDADLLWLHQLWKWPVPLKKKLFIWLSAKGKVLTWEILRKRGWEGPGICNFCKRSIEDIHHILIHCKC